MQCDKISQQNKGDEVLLSGEKIGVVIENLEDVLTQDRAYIFDERGGFIGRDSQCSFCVQDKENKICDKHVKIGFDEGYFTISPVEEALVFYNESFSQMRGDFETIISKGDTFRISNIRFSVVDSKEIDETFVKGKEKLADIEKYNDMDENPLEPRGRVHFDFKGKEEVNALIESKSNHAFIEEKTNNDLLVQNDKKNPSIPTYEDILKTLDKILQELQTNQKNAELNEQYEELDIRTLENIITDTPLIKSTKLINLIALSLISKELYSPIFEEMEENMFMKYLKTAIQNNIKEEETLFENLAIKALEYYKNRHS